MQKIFIILLTLFFVFTINTKAQQNECPQFEWAKGFTSNHGLNIRSSCIDDEGFVYLSGGYKIDIDFGNVNLNPSIGDNATWIAKFDSLGNCIWATQSYNTSFATIKTDNKGNLYLVGRVVYPAQNVIYQQDTLFNIEEGGVVLQIDTSGALLHLEHHPNLYHFNILTAPSGNYYLLSYFNDTAYLGATTLYPTVMSGNEYAVIKLNSQHTVQWVVQGIRIGYQYIEPIPADIDNAENIYLAGTLPSIGSINFGSTVLTCTSDGFIAKLNTNGQYEWANKINCTQASTLRNLALDNLGNIYVIGTIRASADFGNNVTLQFSHNSIEDIFVSRIDMQGVFHHVRYLGLYNDNANNYADIRDMVVDNEGSLYIGGMYYGTFNYGDSTLASQDGVAYISKLIPQEDLFKIAWIMGSQGDTAFTYKLSVNNSKAIYVAGTYKGVNVKIGNHTLPPVITYNTNLFLSKIINDCSLPTEEITNPLQSVSIYPNPAHTNITIANLPHNSTIHITDISGRVLYTQYNKNNSTVQIPVNGISNGMYFVQIINGVSKENRKVVVW